MKKNKLLFIGILVLLFNSCTTQSSSVDELVVASEVENSETENTESLEGLNSSVEIIPTTSIVMESDAEAGQTEQEVNDEQAQKPQYTATPDTRLSPEQWRDWPYMPEVSQRAIDIYQIGAEKGTDPHAFSVVGDCQSIRDVFLGKYDHPANYTLAPTYGHLQETIEQFAGSFDREGMAVRGGFTAASLLNPMQADPEYCKPGETPLGCEFRVHNPSILIISLETWSDPKTIDRYEMYLEEIIKFSIERGVLPILATKADVAEVGNGRHIINPAVVGLAYQYDLPLWNFWRQAQNLPNFGIDAERDGFHLSEDGFNLKSLTGLQALDTVWRAVNEDDTLVSATATTVINMEPTATEIPEASTEDLFLKIGDFCALQDDIYDCVMFALAESKDGLLVSKGVYLFDINSEQTKPLSVEGVDLQDVSSDGKCLLVNHETDLYYVLRDGTKPVLISEHFYPLGEQCAYWFSDYQTVIFISETEGGTALQRYDLETQHTEMIGSADVKPVHLYASGLSDQIVWETGACDSWGDCEYEGVKVTDLNSGQVSDFGTVHQPVFSPESQSVAFMDPEFNAEFENEFNDRMLVAEVDDLLLSRRLVVFPPAEGFKVRPRLLDYYWSPDGRKVLALVEDYSNYFEKTLVLRTHVFQLTTGILLDYEKLYGGFKPQAAWSPDGERFLMISTMETETGQYRLHFMEQVLTPRSHRELANNEQVVNENYFYVTNLFWGY